MCIYVCEYMCIYVCEYMCIYVCAHVCMCLCRYACMQDKHIAYPQIHSSIHKFSPTLPTCHNCTTELSHIHIHIHIHMHVYASHTHTTLANTRITISTHTHTHVHASHTHTHNTCTHAYHKRTQAQLTNVQEPDSVSPDALVGYFPAGHVVHALAAGAEY